MSRHRQNQSQERRRPEDRTAAHSLAVYLVRDEANNVVLQTRCSCGVVVGTRYEDRVKISLVDLCDLVRIHSRDLDKRQ